MDSDLPSPAKLVAAHLVIVVAVVHLSMGLYEWFRYASVGFLVPPDLRWPLFVVSGFAMIVGLFIAAQGLHRRLLYSGGIVLMVAYVVGYFGWHLGGHRAKLLFSRGTDHHGPLGQFLLDHLFAGVVEFLAIVSEVALALVLVYLLVKESR
jgi:hypothetical protein